jgi:hypothetical protein
MAGALPDPNDHEGEHMATGPFGTLRAVDPLVVRDGRIVSDTLVFDTYEVRMASA